MAATVLRDRPSASIEVSPFDAAQRLAQAAPPGVEATYGPYQRRRGTRLYWYGQWLLPDGHLHTEYLGPAGDAYSQGPVTVEIPPDLEEDLASAYVWSKGYYFARVYKPLGRLLRLMGTRLRTDEEVP